MTQSRFARLLPDVLQYLVLSVAAFLSIFPFLWMVIGATNSSGDIIKGKTSFGAALSTNVTNFFTLVDVPLVFWNSAKVDGLKEWQIFLFIYVPVMRSTYAAAFVIVFMTAWNNYLWPLIVLQSNETKTITLVISSLASAYYPDYGVVMIGTILATLPTLAVFFLMQRQFVQGMLGSVK